MKSRKWIVALVIAGCGWTSDEPVPAADPTESDIERELGVAADRASGMAAQEALAAGAAGAAGVNTDQTARGIEQLGVALGERLENAGEMPGGEPCVLAYGAAVEARIRAGAAAPTQAAHDSYLETCRRLPEDARRCVVPGYVANHADTCESVLQREDVRDGVAELRALVAVSS